MSFSFALNIFKKTSFIKLLNASLLYVSFQVSRLLKRPIHWGAPMALSIEPTTSCNLRCPECPSGLRSFTRNTGMLQNQLFEKIINDTRPYLSYLTFYFQGEPFLNTHFLSMVKFAHDRNVFTATSTNAHFLTPQIAEETISSGLDKLIISLDGITQETYVKYRIGGTLDKVLVGTKNIIDAKKKLNSKTPHVVFQFLVVKHNEHEIEQAKILTEDLGVDEIVFKTAQVYDYENGNDLIPDYSKYSRYVKTATGKYKLKSSLENSCWRMWSSAVITWDGKMVPCCFDKDAQHLLGDVNIKNINEVWKSNDYNNFRNSILKSRSEIEICKNCSEGSEVFA
jgi:radical SAM protein with 4Fe4S-binding SPASM domain